MTYLEQLSHEVGDAREFVLDQAPLVAQEYLWSYWWDSMAGIAVSATFLLAIAGFARVIVTKVLHPLEGTASSKAEIGVLKALVAFVAVGLSTICITNALGHIFELARISYAPRVVILEKLASLLS